MTASAEDRWWNLFLGIVAAGVTCAVWVETDVSPARRLTGVGAIVLITLLYVFWGRTTGRDRIARGVAFCLVAVLIFAVGTAAATTVSYLLFALNSAVFLILPLRPAIPVVVVASLTPVFVAVPRDGLEAAGRLGPIFVVSAAISVWLGIWINHVITQSRERADLIDELRETRAENERLSHEAGAAAERERLAGEIHDTLAQGFTSIITLLQAVDPALSDERLALAVRTARENLAESRTLIAALSPSALASGSLTDAVRRAAHRLTEESGIPATVRVTGEPRDLPTAVEVVLLRTAQEALTNVRRHAGATHVTVLLAFGPGDGSAAGSVRLVVGDDGRGFDPGAAGGFGLRTMRARAEQVRGSLAVRSRPGAATTIELEVPA
jgi:signal transduction histidine kinase